MTKLVYELSDGTITSSYAKALADRNYKKIFCEIDTSLKEQKTADGKDLKELRLKKFNLI